jgi:alpha-beta hydrolase superfamily lysophospholipase
MDNRYHTTHLAFAAWLHARGYDIVGLDINRPGHGEFEYAISEKEVAAERVEYANSIVSKYNSSMSQLKSLCYGSSVSMQRRN